MNMSILFFNTYITKDEFVLYSWILWPVWITFGSAQLLKYTNYASFITVFDTVVISLFYNGGIVNTIKYGLYLLRGHRLEYHMSPDM